MRGFASSVRYAVRTEKPLAIRGGAMRTFGSLAAFVTLALLCLGVFFDPRLVRQLSGVAVLRFVRSSFHPRDRFAPSLRAAAIAQTSMGKTPRKNARREHRAQSLRCTSPGARRAPHPTITPTFGISAVTSIASAPESP
jgi:hypothetical protein